MRSGLVRPNDRCTHLDCRIALNVPCAWFYASVGLDVTFSPISWQLKRNMCLRASECLPVRVVGPVQRDILACVSGVSILLVDSRVLGQLWAVSPIASN